MYKLICFDLDDTLWPCMPTIEHAEKTLYTWMQLNKPYISDNYSIESLRTKRKDLFKQYPELVHDLSEARRVHLKQLADEFGDTAEWVEDAFNVFYQARQQVNLFEDVIPVLSQLKADFTLVALTNGNAHIKHTGLDEYFDFQVSAADVQAAKPNPAMFIQAMQQAKVDAEHTLHVGDHPVHDIQGAKNAGIDAVWLRRFNQVWDSELAEPDYAFSGLKPLRNWLLDTDADE